MDIIKRIDRLINEFSPFFMGGVISGRMMDKASTMKGMDAVMRELVNKVLYHTEKDRMKAVEMVIKNDNVSKKRAKELRKFFKRYGKKNESMNESKISQTILNQIKSLNKWALDSWGAKNYIATDNGIQFDVRGSKFRGRIVIELDKSSDTYTIEFGNVRKLEWVVKKKLENIFAEDLVNVLDQHIG